ncbi:MAG: ribonuclease P protein component [Lachnospiraceae bacterium]|nr:ribonuclease P protein component [Lachnospiraceae bacterium]
MRDRSELTLRKQRDFSRVYNRGSSRGSRYVVILYRANGLGYTRTAFVASKKVGNSVTRNRARRLMKEAYRSLEGRIAKGYDIIFVARNTIADSMEPEVEKVMKNALRGCGLIA